MLSLQVALRMLEINVVCGAIAHGMYSLQCDELCVYKLLFLTKYKPESEAHKTRT